MDGSIGHWKKNEVNELIKGCLLDMNGMNTFESFKIIPLDSYYALIEIDWFYAHHVVLDCRNKSFTCLSEERKQMIVKCIPRPISIRKISSLQLKPIL